jgi:hypothetical protein
MAADSGQREVYMSSSKPPVASLPVFDRKFWDGTFRCTQIGTGQLGGKAGRLVFIKDLLASRFDAIPFPGVEINVPTMAVIATDFFDEFVNQNRLAQLRFDEMEDDRIAHAFQNADLPVQLLGDLRALIMQVKTPLAVRSSSVLEDTLEMPFAGVYATKMIPNNQHDPDARFRKLVEAIKFVYASTYFREARDYRAFGGASVQERMAVILQEVVGQRRDDRFYPDVSGVARSYNFYAVDPAMPEDGVVSLALGLGKTIVDGGIAWTFSPRYPKKPQLFGSARDLLEGTQTEFWAVNMGRPPAYDPASETEYLVRAHLADADADGTLHLLASTYNPERDRVVSGAEFPGPRILNFAPMLVGQRFPINELAKALLKAAEESIGGKVEIEFALTLPPGGALKPVARLGFLQVRSTVVTDQIVEVLADELENPQAIVASDRAIGNGSSNDIRDILYVRPDTFSLSRTPLIAQQLGAMNRELQQQHRPFLLIGFGRWGSSHPSLGIPVDWGQISGARAIVEATLPDMNVEFSQGSHFFHNLSSFRTTYFMVQHEGRYRIRWDWLDHQPILHETEFIRHVRPAGPILVKVDGRTRRGIILPDAAGPRVAASEI